jgi:hypothetical protein
MGNTPNSHRPRETRDKHAIRPRATRREQRECMPAHTRTCGYLVAEGRQGADEVAGVLHRAGARGLAASERRVHLRSRVTAQGTHDEERQHDSVEADGGCRRGQARHEGGLSKHPASPEKTGANTSRRHTQTHSARFHHRRRTARRDAKGTGAAAHTHAPRRRTRTAAWARRWLGCRPPQGGTATGARTWAGTSGSGTR